MLAVQPNYTHIMTLKNLLIDLDALRGQHPLTPTNIEGFSLTARGVEFDTDIRKLQEELEESKDEFNRAKKEINKLETKLKNQISLKQKYEETLDQVSDGEFTLRGVIDRMTAAEDETRQARERIREWDAEVTALRKRKGADANYFKCRQEVYSFLYSAGIAGAELLKKLRA